MPCAVNLRLCVHVHVPGCGPNNALPLYLLIFHLVGATAQCPSQCLLACAIVCSVGLKCQGMLKRASHAVAYKRREPAQSWLCNAPSCELLLTPVLFVTARPSQHPSSSFARTSALPLQHLLEKLDIPGLVAGTQLLHGLPEVLCLPGQAWVQVACCLQVCCRSLCGQREGNSIRNRKSNT